MDNAITRTDITGRPVVERRHVSFSAMNNFANCPRKFFLYEVSKTIQEPENDNMKEGFRVHKAMADFVSKGTPLPPQYERYADWVTTMRTHNHDEIVLTEQKFACTFQMKPCQYFDRNEKVWLRSTADLVVINNLHALNVDWKTGKEPDPRYELLPPNFQLNIAALMIMLNYPQVERVENKYVYLNQGTATTSHLARSDLRQFVPQLYDTAASIQKAVRNDMWPPRPSGLCKKHCAVTHCQYHGKGA